MRPRWFLCAYAVIVLGAAHVAALATRSANDASIGGVLLLLAVAFLGLPWSIGYFAAFDWAVTGTVSEAFVLSGLAVLNAVLVTLVVGRPVRPRAVRADQSA
ncbi:hypothetical protein [Nocardioides massiliensis]|uniref:Uncharacterized protein n=1 Tax=Nocardioides massiliensis TaxID=1325935 RepID=A0ABT9NR64_9ACTN|nr:hypothetical protein [Nocardioides massiliensis]MDP9822927.1 hypothetical protein [Nocardioides massiliensis]